MLEGLNIIKGERRDDIVTGDEGLEEWLYVFRGEEVVWIVE